MAGLALKGIMFGVDKIPDKWFDKIPYYQSEEAKHAKKSAKRSNKEGRHRRHASVDDKYYEDHHARRSGDRRRRRSYDDDDPYLNDDDTTRYRRSRDENGRRFDGDRRGYDGAASGDYAQPRAQRPNEYPVNHASVVPQPHPRSNGYGHPANGTAIGSAAYGSQQPMDRPPSGPVPGYVPYANIYNGSPTQANYNAGDQFGSRHGSIQYNGGLPQAQPRQPYIDEPRGYHGRRRDSRYDSDSYDSDDSRRHRRRHRSRDRASSQGGHRRKPTWK